jgi:predicted RNA-binding protein YlxR (DUF448 family)
MAEGSKKKASFRRCIVCRETAEANELLRFVKVDDVVVLDFSRGVLARRTHTPGASGMPGGKPAHTRVFGRGCSLHFRTDCVNKMVQPKLWGRVLRASGDCVSRLKLVALQESVRGQFFGQE